MALASASWTEYGPPTRPRESRKEEIARGRLREPEKRAPPRRGAEVRAHTGYPDAISQSLPLTTVRGGGLNHDSLPTDADRGGFNPHV